MFDKISRKFFVIVVLFFLLVRILHLPQSVGFGSDAGRDFLRILELTQNRDFTLIGPPSRFVVDGHSFYFGPAPYYIMLPGLIIGNWDVLFVSYYLIVLNLFAFVISLMVLAASIKKKQRFTLWAYAVFIAFLPLLVNTSRTYWNPYFMPAVSFLVISLIVKIKNSLLTPVTATVLGFLFGLGMQFHYSYILAVFLSILLLIRFRKLTKMGLLLVLTGLFLGAFPLILFELRNNFYNTGVFLLAVKKWSGSSNFGFGLYYLMSIVPFVVYFAAYVLMQVKKRNARLAFVIVGIFILLSLIVLVPTPKKALDMADDWNYAGLDKASKIILSDDPKKYNVVDQLTGDNRAMALRYFLTSQGKEPMGVTEYPAAEYVYVITREPLDKILINPVWEICSGHNVKNIREWTINEKVNLYKLGK